MDRLVYINFIPSLSTLSRPHLLRKLAPVVRDISIFDLVCSFLELPVLDKDGIDRSSVEGFGIPPAGPIASFLLNFILDSVDREFLSVFPRVSYTRCFHGYINLFFKKDSANQCLKPRTN